VGKGGDLVALALCVLRDGDLGSDELAGVQLARTFGRAEPLQAHAPGLPEVLGLAPAGLQLASQLGTADGNTAAADSTVRDIWWGARLLRGTTPASSTSCATEMGPPRCSHNSVISMLILPCS
jgi:hypothetical protein